jgi:hypothetical protein
MSPADANIHIAQHTTHVLLRAGLKSLSIWKADYLMPSFLVDLTALTALTLLRVSSWGRNDVQFEPDLHLSQEVSLCLMSLYT